MKSFWQMGLLVIVLMGIVAGATYLTQYTPRVPVTDRPPPPDGEKQGKAVVGRLLKFQNVTAVWDPSIEAPITKEEEQQKYSKQVEVHSKNHYDFWFNNAQTVPVLMNIHYKSCTCSDVQLFLFPSDAWQAWQRLGMLAGCLPPAGANLLGPAAAAVLLQPASQEPAWVLMNLSERKDQKAIPAAVNGVAQPGIMRVNFEPKALNPGGGTNLLNITVHAETTDGGFDAYKQELRYEVMAPFGTFPPLLDAGDLTAGEKRVLDCFVWSTTREKLDLKIDLTAADSPSTGETCFEVGALVPLTPEQRAALPKGLGERYEHLRLRCAYRFPVTIHERRGDKQLDMGPINRRLTISVDPALDDARIPVTGLVRGEVLVNGGDDRDRIQLGSFKLERGASKAVTLTTTNSSLNLQIDTTTSALLKKPRLEPVPAQGRKEWRLIVEVGPNAVGAGDLPPGTAVVLTTQGANSRRVRIPVLGNAFR